MSEHEEYMQIQVPYVSTNYKKNTNIKKNENEKNTKTNNAISKSTQTTITYPSNDIFKHGVIP